MRAADLGLRRVAVWGLAREGRAAIELLRKHHPGLPLVLLDDAADAYPPQEAGGNVVCAFGAEKIAGALDGIDVIVKSPGVSLYRPEVQAARDRGVEITSLLNLWFAEQPAMATICVTGTKGKSTTASLIAHIFTGLGRRVALVGNIGIPITAIDTADCAIIEVSSYQAADFDGLCDVAVLTSLFPEHVDWHLSVAGYFRDKINLLNHSRCRIVNRDAVEAIESIIRVSPYPTCWFNDQSGIRSCGTSIFDGRDLVGEVRNPYLARAHNRSNLCAALAAANMLGVGMKAALAAIESFRGLPHRQQELGEIAGVLFVDDSISTIPESTIAALEVYAGRDIAVIVGGYDRGIDYRRLVEKLSAGAAKAVICLGDSGQRIYAQMRAALSGQRDFACAIEQAASMAEAVALARLATPPGGVVLLSPAAPSYGHYRDFIERGRDFAAQLVLSKPS